jgi:hypothetical protein
MAGFSWAGLDRAYTEKMAEVREDRQRQEDIYANRMEALFGKEGLMLASSPNFFKSSKSRQESDPKGSESAYAAYLKKNYNVSDDVLAPLMASKDKTALKRLSEILDEQNKAYQAEKRPFPSDIVNTIIEGAIIEMPDNKPINFAEVEKYIGQELTDLQKQILTQKYETPGSVLFSPVEYSPNPTLQDLEAFEKRVVSNIINRANSDLDPIIQRLSEINQLGQSTALTDTQEKEKDWLSIRMSEIEDAKKSYEDFGNVVPMVKLYGNTYVQDITEQYGIFKDAPINTALRDIAPASPIEVPNRAVAEALMNNGILKPGDIVLNLETGRYIPIQAQPTT